MAKGKECSWSSFANLMVKYESQDTGERGIQGSQFNPPIQAYIDNYLCSCYFHGQVRSLIWTILT